jgi:hypothetical protein
VQNGFDFFRRHIEDFSDLRKRHACLQILEYRLNRHPRSAEDLGTAYFAGDAFYGWALGPIEGWHAFRITSLTHGFDILVAEELR